MEVLGFAVVVAYSSGLLAELCEISLLGVVAVQSVISPTIAFVEIAPL